MSTLSLASEFPAATHDQWRKLVDGVLKGADFDKRLVSRTYDGIAIAPLGARVPCAVPVSRRKGAAPWLIAQRIDLPEARQANAQVLDDLMGGASALTLVFADSPAANGSGLKDASRETLTKALAEVHLDMGVALDLDIGRTSKDAGAVIGEIARQKGLTPGQLTMSFGYNPIGMIAAGRGAPAEWAALAPMVASMVGEHIAAGFTGPFMAADGRLVHAAGGSEAQELAYVLACGVAYLRALEAGGLSLEAARDAIYVRLASDADQFQSIAKLRALRKLWARVEAACGLPPKPVHLVAETAWRMLSRNDPHVNILRNSVAVFAAAVGGADVISSLPFTAALGLPDAAARRLARNTQVVLAEESNLFRMADPAAGAGAVEALTDGLLEAAWALFQGIETAGGIVAALESGSFSDTVAATRAARLRAISTRKDPITGVSEFPNVAEAPVAVLAPLPALGTGPFAPWRLAEPYEALRDRAAQTAQRPVVFLANLGTVADFTARTIFAKNFFEAGGIAAPTNNGFASLEAMVAAFKTSGARLACLCSTDAIYATEAEAAARALADAGAVLYLAGRPGEMERILKTAGVTRFVFAGCDVIETLSEAQKLAGVS
ncbi:MAG: methylmalonyl-CoA mutase family protein [Proteobacteria bacterium]|nr:methylmalonyl-CoA mutase family protein [Pseudomonadota bacterium]